MNAPEPAGAENGVDEQNTVESPEEQPTQHLPPQQSRPGMPQNTQQMHPNYMPLEQQQAIAYQNYVAQQQRGGYPMPPAGMPQQHSHQA